MRAAPAAFLFFALFNTLRNAPRSWPLTNAIATNAAPPAAVATRSRVTNATSESIATIASIVTRYVRKLRRDNSRSSSIVATIVCGTVRRCS